MSLPLPNPPYTTPLNDPRGMLSSAWLSFFRILYQRVGSQSALSNTELEALSGGNALQSEVTALTATVTANEIATLSSLNDLGQGRQL